MGWSERVSVWILYGLALGSGALAVLAASSSGDAAWSAAYLCGCVGIFLGIHLAAVVTYPEAEFQNARQKSVWIAYWWQAVDLRLLERILDACAILLVWRWDNRLAPGTVSATQHSLLLVTSLVLIKCACLIGMGVYRDSWRRITRASMTRLLKPFVLAELISLQILYFALQDIGHASQVAGFDYCLLFVTCLAIRFAFQSIGSLLDLKQA